MKILAHDCNRWGVFPAVRRIPKDFKSMERVKISAACAKKITRLYGYQGLKYSILIRSIVGYFSKIENKRG